MPQGCLQFANVVFPDHTHLLFLKHSSDGLLNFSSARRKSLLTFWNFNCECRGQMCLSLI